MRKLTNLIYSLYSQYYSEIALSFSDISKSIEYEVNKVIRDNFKKVKRKKYCFNMYRTYKGTLVLHFDSELEDEMKKHYPEEFI